MQRARKYHFPLIPFPRYQGYFYAVRLQSTRFFALFHTKSFKKQLETLLLRWYNKTVILWENRRMPSADRPRAWGILWGV